MKILLTTSPAPKKSYFCTGEKLFPIGIASLASVLRDEGHEVIFRDPYYSKSEIPTMNELSDINVIGIYVSTICYREFVDMVNYWRESGYDGVIVAGGPHWSTVDEIGDDIINAVESFVEGEAEKEIEECCFRSGYYKCDPINDLDSLPFPAYDLISDRKYGSSGLKPPMFNLCTSRGCPYNCSFCSSKPVSGSKYRFQGAERVIDEIIYIRKNFQVNSLYFRENNFCFNRDRVEKICEWLIGKNLEWKCESSVRDLDFELLKLMKESGMKELYVGVETGSEKLLPKLKPGFTLDDNIKIITYCRQLGIPLHASFLVGSYYETEEDIIANDEFVKKYLSQEEYRPNIYVGLPGSKMYDELDASGDYWFKDDIGLIFLHGHNDRVKKYFGDRAKHFMVEKE